MSGISTNPADYYTLEQGDHGLLLALVVTIFVLLGITSGLKLYLTCRRFLQQDVSSTAVLLSDGWWLAAHVLGFVYLGLRVSTLGDLTDGHARDVGPRRQVVIGRVSEAAQILAMITLYVSFASVLSTVLLIRRVAKRIIVYTAPFVVAVVGLLLSTLPFIGCGERHIFPGAQMVCKSAAARLLPSLLVLMLTEVVMAVYWPVFVAKQQSWRSKAGNIQLSTPWPVAPFLLRLLVVGAVIAYVDISFSYASRGWEYSATFYPELLMVLFSLSATTSISMTKVLGKFSFGGVAYTEDPRSRSHGYSGDASGSTARQRNGDGSRSHYRSAGQSQNGVQGSRRRSQSPKEWGYQPSTVKNHVTSQHNRRGSGESEARILGDQVINRRVDIDIQEERTSAKSGISDL